MGYKFEKKHVLVFFWIIFGNLYGLQVKAKGTQTPVRIRSDIIDIKQKSNSIEFLKNVAVEKETSSLTADKMIVIYSLKKNEGNQASNKSEIKQIDAVGNVKIFSEEFVASGNHGYYSPRQNTFILKENVIVNNGTSIASGSEFIYQISTKKGEFIGKKSGTIRNGAYQALPQGQKLNSLIKEKQEETTGDERITIIINEEAESKNHKSNKPKDNSKN